MGGAAVGDLTAIGAVGIWIAAVGGLVATRGKVAGLLRSMS